jgi:hypothetical protein
MVTILMIKGRREAVNSGSNKNYPLKKKINRGNRGSIKAVQLLRTLGKHGYQAVNEGEEEKQA